MSTSDTRDRLAEELTAPVGRSGSTSRRSTCPAPASARVLRVAVDKDGGVTMDDIAEATRAVSRLLDDSDVMGEQPYTLEVSSPRRRPAADPAAPLAAQPAAGWSRSPCARASRSPAGSPPATTTPRSLDVEGDRAARRLRRRDQAKIQIEFNEASETRLDIDMSILRMLEREKEISFEVLVEAIEQALLTAYHKTAGAQRARPRRARPQDRPRDRDGAGDRRGGQRRRGVRRHARGLRPDRRHDREADHAAAAARRRGRARFGEFSGKEGDIISGVIQQGRDPDDVMVDLGKLEALLPLGRAGPGEDYSHGTRIKCLVISVRKGMRGPAGDALAHPPQPGQEAVRARGARDRRRHRRDHRRSPARPVTAPRSRSGPTCRASTPKGSCIGPMGQRVRNVMNELHGEKIDIVDWSDDPAELVGNALSPARVSSVDRGRRGGPLRAGGRPRLPALAGDRQGGPERPPRRPPDRLAHRHPLRRGTRGRPERRGTSPVASAQRRAESAADSSRHAVETADARRSSRTPRFGSHGEPDRRRPELREDGRSEGMRYHTLVHVASIWTASPRWRRARTARADVVRPVRRAGARQRCQPRLHRGHRRDPGAALTRSWSARTTSTPCRGRLREQGRQWWADPHRRRAGRDQPRGRWPRALYWEGPDGHWLEIITGPTAAGATGRVMTAPVAPPV